MAKTKRSRKPTTAPQKQTRKPMRQVIAEQQAEITNLKCRLGDTEDEYNEARRLVVIMQSQREQYLSDLQQSRKSVSFLDQDCAQKDTRLAELSAYLISAQATICDLKRTVNDLTAQYTRLASGQQETQNQQDHRIRQLDTRIEKERYLSETLKDLIIQISGS